MELNGIGGSYEKSPYSWLTLFTSWTSTRNVEDNSTTVVCTHKLIATGNINIGSKSGSCNVGGVTKSFTSPSISGTGSYLLGTTIHTVKHNDDGTKSVNLSTTFNIKATLSGTYVASITASDTATLYTIPRASGVTCNSFYIGDSTTINISRSSSRFTHTIKYVYGNLSGTIAEKTSETSLGWTAPNTFYNQIPNGTTGYGSIVCETYNGNTLIGTKTANFNAYAKASDCFPEVSSTVRETNESVILLTGDNITIVKYLSKPKVSMTATAKNYATIKTQSINWTGENSISASEYTFSNGVTSPYVNVSVTDSRDYTVTDKLDLVLNNLWVEYVKLAFSKISLSRTESTTSTVTIKVNGNYFNGSFGAVQNDFTLKYRYREEGGSYGEYITVEPARTNDTFDYSGTIENIDYQKQYYFEFVVEDKAMVVSSGEKILEKGEAIFRIGQDYTKTNGRILDYYGTQVLNGMSKYEGGGSTDVNTTLEELVLSTTNTPDTGFWYVKTMFYVDKTETSNRTQLAYPYNRVAPTMCRYYINGVGWSEWSSTDIINYVHSDMNGYIHFSNGLLIQWGRVAITPNSANTITQASVVFPIAYDEIPKVNADPHASYPNIITCSVGGGTTVDISKRQMVIYMTRTNTVATSFQWFAIGYKAPY